MLYDIYIYIQTKTRHKPIFSCYRLLNENTKFQQWLLESRGGVTAIRETLNLLSCAEGV